jgi:hypothetical protein
MGSDECGIAVHVAVLSEIKAADVSAKSKPYLEEVGDFTAMGAVGLAGGLGEGHALSPRGCLVFAVVGGFADNGSAREPAQIGPDAPPFVGEEFPAGRVSAAQVMHPTYESLGHVAVAC